MILIINNYNSFTYNLINIITQHTNIIIQYPNNNNILNQSINTIIISPNPKHPLNDQQLIKIISTYQHKPILNIYLNTQTLTYYYNKKIIKNNKIIHKKINTLKIISHHQHLLYQNIPKQFSIIKYHSLINNPNNFPKKLKITKHTKNYIQSFKHKKKPHYNIQYHPKSFTTNYNIKIITNFINLIKKK